MKVINLFGCPSSGKTTAAHALVGYLKYLNINAEFSGEVPKELIYSGNEIQLENQFLVSALQYKKLHDMNRYGLDIVVTDAPLQLQKLYVKDRFYAKEFCRLIDKIVQEFQNYNILIKRVIPFNQHGRVTNEKHAKQIETELKKLNYNLIINGDSDGHRQLFNWVEKI